MDMTSQQSRSCLPRVRKFCEKEISRARKPDGNVTTTGKARFERR
jgi:hypothetical protein